MDDSMEDRHITQDYDYSEEDMEAILDFMAAHPLFSDLTPEDRRLLAGHLVPLDVFEGDFIIVDGEKGDCVYFVMKGCLEVTKGENYEGRRVVAELAPGDSVGEMALVGLPERSANVMAVTDTRLLSLSKKSFDELLARRPESGIRILLGLVRMLCRRLRQTSTELVEHMFPLV